MAIDDLDGRLDADLTFAGPGIDQISIDLKAKGTSGSPAMAVIAPSSLNPLWPRSRAP